MEMASVCSTTPDNNWWTWITTPQCPTQALSHSNSISDHTQHQEFGRTVLRKRLDCRTSGHTKQECMLWPHFTDLMSKHSKTSSSTYLQDTAILDMHMLEQLCWTGATASCSSVWNICVSSAGFPWLCTSKANAAVQATQAFVFPPPFLLSAQLTHPKCLL